MLNKRLCSTVLFFIAVCYFHSTNSPANGMPRTDRIESNPLKINGISLRSDHFRFKYTDENGDAKLAKILWAKEKGGNPALPHIEVPVYYALVFDESGTSFKIYPTSRNDFEPRQRDGLEMYRKKGFFGHLNQYYQAPSVEEPPAAVGNDAPLPPAEPAEDKIKAKLK